MRAALLERLGEVRHDWTIAEVRTLLALPFADLLFHAQRVHRQNFDPNRVQVSTLLSIKTGACPEDCSYCPQSVRFETGVNNESLLPLPQVLEHARAAKAAGATRFCMGAAWRSPKRRDMEVVIEMVKTVNALGLESCATLGMLTPEQARELKDAKAAFDAKPAKKKREIKLVGGLVARSAAWREESRGCHYRSDHSEARDAVVVRDSWKRGRREPEVEPIARALLVGTR